MSRRRWCWGLAFYLTLLLASHLWQWWSDSPQTSLPPGYTQTTIQDHGRAIRIAYFDSTLSLEHSPHSPIIVLLHGSPGAASNFSKLIPLLVDHARVIAIDLPGFGYSQRWIDDYGIAAHSRMVRALLNELKVERAHLLGFSMGSGVALHLADDTPNRVASLILYGGIGLQEHEGSGDHHFEHLKYRIGYALLVGLPKVVPHFGLLGSDELRYSFIRNFMDSDQRPLRGVLERLNDTRIPMLILHGRDDPLVPASAAYAHHELVRHSELVMFDDSHFMLFDASHAKPQALAGEILPFVARSDGGQVQRRTVDHTAHRPPPSTILPIGVDLRAMSPWAQMGAIILSSYVLEDPTTVLAGLLVKEGQLDLFVAVMGVFVGIFTGDLLLYGLGWFGGRRVLRWRHVARRLPVHQVDALGAWFDRHGWTAVLACRFIPGTRLPLYVAAGATGRRPLRFAMWAGLSVLIWAPAMLILVIVLGAAAASPLKAIFGERSWLAAIVAIVLLLVALRVFTLATTSVGRARLIVAVSRWWRVEFWPAWAFYLPLVPRYAWLSLRHRSFTVWTLADPGIPHGGVVGESKFDILSKLDERYVIPSARIGEDASVDRVRQLKQVVRERGWEMPLVLKPDAGQRGVSVKLIRTWEDAQRYLDATPGPILAQTYDPGPYEAGVFYYRFPGDSRDGRILAITDKVFPVLEGDGRHTLEQLIWRHRRYRMQAGVFLQRHELQRDRILARGERLPLAMAGNHCQGTLFRDGSHLASDNPPKLAQALDRALSNFRGFYIGRFDVRYSDPDALRNGRGFAIVELNGVTSEATAIYDPTWPLWKRYQVLFRQWSLLFAIGDAVRRGEGAQPIGWLALLRMVRAYYRSRSVEAVSD